MGEKQIQGLLLAAGSSMRFGGAKLLTRLPDSNTVLSTSAKRLRSCVDRLAVVVNPDHQAVIDEMADQQLAVITCAESQFGIGHSIACGVSETNDAAGWVIALADMPFISMEIIQQIINTLKKGALITVPVCDGRRGHPVGFTRMLYPELIQLQGDSGGKSLLNRYKSNVVEIECQDPGIYCDIDTPQDFEKYSKKFCYSEEQNIKPLAPE